MKSIHLISKYFLKYFFFWVFLLAFNSKLSSQLSFGLSIGGLAIHQGDTYDGAYYKLKLDRKGRAIVFGGLTFSLSYRINPYIGIKAVQSLVFYDSAGKMAGISHLGVDLHDDLIGMKMQNHHLSMSTGPFWYYRKGWNEIEAYEHDPDFISKSKNAKWEHKFVLYGGFMRYNYSIDEQTDFALDFLPAYPFVYAFSAGLSKN